MNQELIIKLESLLYISNKPLGYEKLAELSAASVGDVRQAIDKLKEKYNQNNSGIKLLDNGHHLQMATAPEASGVIEDFLKQELTGEMTKPQLETLAVIAYRGPILKIELEQIRGVNSSLILRNLLIRGLIEVVGQGQKGLPRYRISLDFLKFLGVDSAEQLPDYAKLSQHENIETLLASRNHEITETTANTI